MIRGALGVQGSGPVAGDGQASRRRSRSRSGILALLPGAFEKVVPEIAPLEAPGVTAVDQAAGQPVPPLLEPPAELLATDFTPMLLPAARARVRVPPEAEDGGEPACPDFTLHAARVGTFGAIQAQDPFALAEDKFNLPAEAVAVTVRGAGQFSGGRIGAPSSLFTQRQHHKLPRPTRLRYVRHRGSFTSPLRKCQQGGLALADTCTTSVSVASTGGRYTRSGLSWPVRWVIADRPWTGQ